jgi:hypothetical protein
LRGGIPLIDNTINYSIQLAMLRQLLQKKKITEKEYSVIKIKITEDYKRFQNISEKIS